MIHVNLTRQEEELRNRVLSMDADAVRSLFESLEADAAALVLKFCFAYERAMQLVIEDDVPIAPQLRRYFRKMLGGQLLPDLYAKCQSNLRLLQKAQYLPIDDQRKIADNEPLKVMETGGDFRMVPALSLTPQEIKQVFDGDALADEATQISLRRRLLEAAAIRQREDDLHNPIQVDKRRRRLIVGNVELTPSDLARYLAELT